MLTYHAHSPPTLEETLLIVSNIFLYVALADLLHYIYTHIICFMKLFA